MPGADGISIVIPTCGRIALIKSLLASIAVDAHERTFPVEVILADSSSPPESEALSDLALAHGGTLVSAALQHAGAARNAGVAHARFDFVLFVDSDVTVCRGTIQAHYDALHAGADACAGLVAFTGRPTYAWQSVEVMQLMLPFRYPLVTPTVPWAPAANISFHKACFDAVGGFDPTLPPYGGEDVDLGFRFTDAGYRIQTSRNAVVEHTIETWSKWPQNIVRLSSYGKADFYLIKRHAARTYADVPSPLLAFVVEAALALAIAPAACWYSLIALAIAVLSQCLCYALLKRTKSASVFIHLPGVFIIALLDLGKWIEAVKHRDIRAIFVRLRYLDDIIEKDWREIWAYTWGSYASLLVFVVLIAIELLLARSRS